MEFGERQPISQNVSQPSNHELDWSLPLPYQIIMKIKLFMRAELHVFS